MISAPAPITHSGATVMPSRNVALTPTKQRTPIVTLPEMTACDAMKQWSPISESWPMWLPLQRIDVVPDPDVRLDHVLLEDEAVVAELELAAVRRLRVHVAR